MASGGIATFFRQVPPMEIPTDEGIKSNTKVHPIQSFLRNICNMLPKVDATGRAFHPNKQKKKDKVRIYAAVSPTLNEVGVSKPLLG